MQTCDSPESRRTVSDSEGLGHRLYVSTVCDDGYSNESRTLVAQALRAARCQGNGEGYYMCGYLERELTALVDKGILAVKVRSGHT
jgi:hypothetical protein